jgi:UDP-2,3-diacylglucosamine hydrolase
MLEQKYSQAPVGVIAGEGQMPQMIIEELKRLKRPFFLLAIQGVTSQQLVDEADDVEWLTITRFGQALKACKKRGVQNIVMAGRVKHQKIFNLSWWKFDWVTVKFCLSLKDWRADTILNEFCNLFQSKGIEIMSSVHFLGRFFRKKGCLTKTSPSASQWKDIDLGKKIAKQMGGLDIGQTVVIKKLSIVAVEAMEGTDLCLERSQAIAGSECVVVKVSKPNQDMRFDVPVIGLNTIEKMIKIRAAGIAIEAEKTLILDPEVVTKADEHNLFIVTVEPY